MKKQIGLFVIVLAAIAAFGSFDLALAQGPTRPAANDTTRELLEEVRALRQAMQAMQRMSMDSYRSQLLVERIRADREDVRQLTSSLNEARDKLARTESTIPQFIDRQKFLETQAESELNHSKRAELEFEARRTKDSVDNYRSQIDPLREREQQLSSELNTRKARLQELESRLDLLERGIENDRQKFDKDAAPTKNP